MDRAPGVSYNLLMEKCMESLYTDFFTFSRAYEELISGNLMDKISSGEYTGEAVGSTEHLTLTDGGRAVLNDLVSSLNGSRLTSLEEAASAIKEEMARNSGINASMELTNDGKYRITLTCTNDGKPFSAAVTVEDQASAVKICKNWKRNCTRVPEEFLKLISAD